MYRTDIKEMIMILLALCEYNLRFVFSSSGSVQEQATNDARATSI